MLKLLEYLKIINNRITESNKAVKRFKYLFLLTAINTHPLCPPLKLDYLQSSMVYLFERGRIKERGLRPPLATYPHLM